jgi:hypothetical protein
MGSKRERGGATNSRRGPGDDAPAFRRHLISRARNEPRVDADGARFLQ